MALKKSLSQRMKDAREVKHDKAVKNVGPSITFKLRDKQGQAVEFHHYMSPIQQDGASYLIAGVRNKVSEPFQYLRLPLDDQMSIDSFMRLRAAFMNPALYDEIATRATAKAMKGAAISADTQQQFRNSVKWILARFNEGGFAALEKFLDDRVPQDKRQAVAQTYIKILQGSVVDVMDVANEKA
ncbi:cytochrome c biogenesis protein ResB [Paludibacterium denitrificans]|uniref:cytochrome c biogenesis protein ResB n=1 Tax=Paludibacterium denitrificans TaxID=2675226 RepID=UPI0024781437|nr:cytochrome c biogenesis protein ResB [Paludibacterium denitrificans]